MKMHYKIRSVLLSHEAAALTLEPTRWVKDSETETIDDGEGGTMPAWEDTDPSDPKAEPYEDGAYAKMTELRIEGETDWKPGGYLTLTIEPSR